MSTLGIGPVEILVILAVTLIVFGPQRIPELARYVAKAMKMLRDASNELQKQLETQNWDFDLEDKKKKKTTSTSSYDGYGYNSSTTSSSTGSVPSSSSGTDSAPAAAVTDSNPAGGYASSESLSTSPAESGEAPPAAAPTPAAIEDPAKTGDAHRFARELADGCASPPLPPVPFHVS